MPADEFFTNSVIYIANTDDVGSGEPIGVLGGLVPGGHLEWVPDEFLSVSPSPEKQITVWGNSRR